MTRLSSTYVYIHINIYIYIHIHICIHESGREERMSSKWTKAFTEAPKGGSGARQGGVKNDGPSAHEIT